MVVVCCDVAEGGVELGRELYGRIYVLVKHLDLFCSFSLLGMEAWILG